MKRRLSRRDLDAIRKMESEDVAEIDVTKDERYKPSRGFMPEAMIRQIELDRLRRLLNKQNYER